MPLTFPTEITEQLPVDARTGLCSMVTPHPMGIGRREFIECSATQRRRSGKKRPAEAVHRELLQQLQRPS